nr:Piwi domain-containing protein [uncultured Flavobacterium sp.]
MSQQLYFNLLTFEWPQKPITLYFSLEQIRGSVLVYKSNYPNNINEIFPNLGNEGIEKIYTSFDNNLEGTTPLDIDFNDKNVFFYKDFLNYKLYNHFKSVKGVIASKNFIKEPQIWINIEKEQTKDFWVFNKFSLKIQFSKVSKFPELVIAYDDTSKMYKKSVVEVLEDIAPIHIKKIITNKSVYNYQKISPELKTSLDLEKTWPILNRDLASKLNIEVEIEKTKNKYTRYKLAIDDFVNTYLDNKDFKTLIPLHSSEYLKVEETRILNVDKNCNELIFKDYVIGSIPKIDFPRNGALVTSPKPNITIFYIYHESHAEVCSSLSKHLKNGTGDYYKGLYKFANIESHTDMTLAIKYKDENNPLPEILEKLNSANFNYDNTYVAFYISPIGKFDEDKSRKKIYYRVKEELLKRRIISQVIDYDKLKSKINNYQFELNNISLALLAKLEGKPWQLSTSPNKDLIIGVGAFRNIDENTQYVASAFSFNNSGSFKKFEYFTKSDTVQLAGSICNAIDQYAKLEDNPTKVVIHFYKEMSDKELKPIIQKMNRLNLNCPLYIININKTDSEDLIAFDMNWHNRLMPRSGTIIKIGKKQFLLFNNTRYNDFDKHSDLEGYPFPIKLGISSPNNEEELDSYEIKKLIEQVYQFSRLYWKSLRQQNVPITIKYPEMVAEIAPHFESGNIPPHGKEILWFL